LESYHVSQAYCSIYYVRSMNEYCLFKQNSTDRCMSTVPRPRTNKDVLINKLKKTTNTQFPKPKQLTWKQLWHCTPSSDDKTQQDPSQWDKVGAFHDQSWYCKVWRLGAWYHVNENNLLPTQIHEEVKTIKLNAISRK
jgi:hypothetical protein